ncbi:uncharacterized protein TNIN_1881 [Trichonephila inaurata madagascariensis]|uniref:Uncharacterized protein n=1 Tax=Trichonephila inaurata madagascariensis TaxID=2747483 RepID=A0A8X6YLM7_9ARAC|nr:uncharacterized protein TNIN_1881 [Trichonephila inaurata madagascariensis]
MYGVEATLKTIFVEDICYSEKSVLFDTKYQPTGILMSVPHAVSKEPFDCEIILMPPKNYSVVLSIYRYDIYSDDLLTIEDSDSYMISLIGWGKAFNLLTPWLQMLRAMITNLNAIMANAF